LARIPIPASSCQIRISNALSCVLMLCNSGHAMAPRHSHVILKYSWFGMGIWGCVFFVLCSMHQNRSRTHAAHKVGGLLLICGYMRVAQTGRPALHTKNGLLNGLDVHFISPLLLFPLSHSHGSSVLLICPSRTLRAQLLRPSLSIYLHILIVRQLVWIPAVAGYLMRQFQ